MAVNIKNKNIYRLIIVFAGLIGETISFLYVPLIGYMEEKLATKDASYIWVFTRIGLAFAIGIGLCAFCKDFFTAKLRKKMNNKLMNGWLNLVKEKDAEALEKYGLGSYQFSFGKLSVETDLFCMRITVAITAVMLVAMALYIVLFMHYLYLIFILGLMVFMFLSQLLMNPLEKKRMEVNRFEKKNITLMNNMLNSVSIIKNYYMEEKMNENFLNNVIAVKKAQDKEKDCELIAFLYSQVLRCAVILVIPFITCMFVQKGLVTEGAVIISSYAFFFFLGHMMTIIDNIGKIKKAEGDLKTVTECFELPERDTYLDNIVTLPASVEGVVLDYDDKKIKYEKFDIQKSGVLIISGESGSGKTTLLKCLAGIKKAGDGNVYFDEKKIDINCFSGMGVYAPQEPVIFDTDAYTNIRFFKTDTEDSRIEELINALCPECLGVFRDCKNACNLSGGQKQLIGLLRTLVSDSFLIIWDEPTSALNPSNISRLISYLNDYSAKRSFIIATHDEAFDLPNFSRLEVGRNNE